MGTREIFVLFSFNFFCKSKIMSKCKLKNGGTKCSRESREREETKCRMKNENVSLPTALDTIWSLSLEWFIQKMLFFFFCIKFL